MRTRDARHADDRRDHAHEQRRADLHQIVSSERRRRPAAASRAAPEEVRDRKRDRDAEEIPEPAGAMPTDSGEDEPGDEAVPNRWPSSSRIPE